MAPSRAPRRTLTVVFVALLVAVVLPPGAVAQASQQAADATEATVPATDDTTSSAAVQEGRIDVSNQKLRCLYLPGVKADPDTPPPTHIDASNNLLTDINDNVLHGLYLLRSLNLSGNLMHEWGPRGGPRYPFRDLRSLEVLDVSRNQLRHVDRVVLEPLQALRRLNLSANRITYLDAAAFPKLDRLQDLDLARNDMEVIADDAFARLAGLQRLDLRWNRLSTLGERTLRGLTAVQTVLLAGNIISEAVPGALQGLNSLSEISLADNQQVVDLVLVGNRLQRVDLSRIGLTTLPATLTRSVRSLVLPGNKLRIISCGDLDSFPLLQALELSNNGLALVEDDALGRLEQLETLVLKNNSLMMIPPSLPESLVSLQLQDNQIRHIGANDLRGLRRLERLDLSNNQVHHIHDGAFRFLESLLELDLSGNKLLELRAAALAGPVALRSLRLVHLPEIVAPAKWLPFPVVRPERLQHLDLDRSPQLARQLLADTAALMAMPHLQVLRLGSAELHHLRSDLPRLLAHLTHLRLADNPWNCSGLRWLPRWLRGLDADSAAGATCRQPPELAGLQLRNLTEANFNASQHDTAGAVGVPGSDEGEEEDPPPPLALPLNGHRILDDEVALADEEVSIPINEYKRIMIELNKTLAREAAAKEAAAASTTAQAPSAESEQPSGSPSLAVNLTSPVAATESNESTVPPPVAAALSATVNPQAMISSTRGSTGAPTPEAIHPTTTATSSTATSSTASPSTTAPPLSTATPSTTAPPSITASTSTTASPSTTASSTTTSAPTTTTAAPSTRAPLALAQNAPVLLATSTTLGATSTTSTPPTTPLVVSTTSRAPGSATSQAPSPPTSWPAPTTTPKTRTATPTLRPTDLLHPQPTSTPTHQSTKVTGEPRPSSPPTPEGAVNAAGVPAGVSGQPDDTATFLRHVSAAAEGAAGGAAGVASGSPGRAGGVVDDGAASRHATSVVAMFGMAVCCSVAVLLAFAIARNSRHRRQQLLRLHSMEDLVLRGRGADCGVDCGAGLDPRRDRAGDRAGPELW